LDAESFESITRELAASGTTRHLPTLITASRQNLLKRLSVLRNIREDSPWLSRRVPGFHVEGPFISEVDGFRGAHTLKDVRDPTVEEFNAWQEAAGGLIRIVTLAPERPGALKFIEEIASRGIVVSIGHSAADPGRIREAVAAGARMSTHLGNGMAGTIDRHVNPLWEQLASDELTAGLIADSHHLPSAFIKTAFKAKGRNGIVLVSDAATPGGLAPGRRIWAGIDVDVSEEGRISLAGTPYLAGAGLLQKRGIEFLMESTGCRLDAAVTACTVNPAGLIGIDPVGLDIVAFRVISSGSGQPGSAGRVSIEIEKVWLDGVGL
ncbi:MAG: amidohydrolase family protein, partial [Spirochaetaceae bacterium]|nr:amidohydrolase family protein [Spirochaetaceae bacterium]